MILIRVVKKGDKLEAKNFKYIKIPENKTG